MTLSEARITDLLNQARAGDEAACASLIAGLRDRILRWAVVITRDRDDAEDVAQQVSITVHRKLADFEARSSFSTWLYTVVRNAAIELRRNAYRKRKAAMDDEQVERELPEHTVDLLDRLSDRRAAALVRSFFTELPSRQRELIELVDSQGYTAAEAAKIMGIEPETARVHLLRARRALRAKMLEQHPGMFL